MPRSRDGRLILVVLATIAVLTIAVTTGSGRIRWLDLLSGAGTPADAEIVWRIRAPRVCLAFVSGAALAAGGLAFQAVFRNSLATPYTLGVASGASLGAALYMKSGMSLVVAGVSGMALCSWAASALATALLFGLTRSSAGRSSATLLLTGVALGFFFSSVVVAVQYIGDVTTSFRIGRWLMGGLEVVGFDPLWEILPFAAIGIATVVAMRRELDLLSMGDEAATTRGVDATRTKARLLLAVSAMIGAVVAVCGPIGFVGLIVPHVGRIVIGPRHDRLVFATIFGGGAFLVLCDTAARTIIAPVEIPVGIITSLLGGPFFLVLLRRQTSDRTRGVA